MILEQTIEEVEQVDGQNWRANSEDDDSGDEESEQDESLRDHFSLPLRQ